ncbi:MAG: hypothetical protein ACOC2U_01760 [bacterium]
MEIEVTNSKFYGSRVYNSEIQVSQAIKNFLREIEDNEKIVIYCKKSNNHILQELKDKGNNTIYNIYLLLLRNPNKIYNRPDIMKELGLSKSYTKAALAKMRNDQSLKDNGFRWFQDGKEILYCYKK